MAPIEYHARLYNKTELYMKCKRNNRLYILFKPGLISRLGAYLKKAGYLWEQVYNLKASDIILAR
jgi:hypothetical protein